MPATLTTKPATTQAEEDEVEAQGALPAAEQVRRGRRQEAAEGRSGSVSYLLFFSFMAVLLALAALLAVAFKLDDEGQMAMPAAGSGAASRAGGGGTVDVELGEMFVRPSVDSVPAGKVTFGARNTGQLPHELMIERAPIKFDAPGQPTEDAAMGMIEDMEPMHGGRMSVDLKPGRYELFCNLPGHYAAGQHATLTVTAG